MPIETIDQAAHQRFSELTVAQFELVGTIRDGQFTFEQRSDAPILVHGNKLIIGDLHLVVNLREETGT